MRKPPFAWRVFVLAFVPVCGVLVGSLTAVRMMMADQVKEGLRSSLRQTHEFLVRIRSQQELQNTRMLSVIAENPSLKAGFALLRLAGADSEQERRTLEDQILEISQSLGFDLVLAANHDGEWTAGVRRQGEGWTQVDRGNVERSGSGLMRLGGRTYAITAIPVNLGEENLGALAVGRLFDFSEFTTPAVLTHNHRVLESNVPGATRQEIEAALAGCGSSSECELRLDGQTYLSLPVQKLSLGRGYVVRSLQSVDAASMPMEVVMTRVLRLAGTVAVFLLVGVSVVASKSVVRPLTDLANRLSENWKLGEMKPVNILATTREVEELARAFNHAALALSDAQGRLSNAYLEFIQSMASAIDARDVYTAGHSVRVSEYSCAIGQAVGLDEHELEALRVGALLHDVGKIGVPDAVLQKPGRLTDAEFEIIKQHPVIGKRIVERVEGFHRYLPIVELHHESFDGSGYPHGLRGDEVPKEVRIVRVADSYDAMTSDRPYRKGMSHEAAMEILRQCSGTHFDPELVEAFASLGANPARGRDLVSLAEAVGTSGNVILPELAKEWQQ